MIDEFDKNKDGFVDLNEFIGKKFRSQLSLRTQLFLKYIKYVKVL